jgi:hypothetical protein
MGGSLPVVVVVVRDDLVHLRALAAAASPHPPAGGPVDVHVVAGQQGQ